MLSAIVLLWGVASWALYRTLSDEERKLELIQEQGTIDTYSPRALSDLQEWIETHPSHPKISDAREAYNECVDILREIDEPFYDWSEAEIKDLEKLSD